MYDPEGRPTLPKHSSYIRHERFRLLVRGEVAPRLVIRLEDDVPYLTRPPTLPYWS